MKTIKRYKNRKMYSVELNRYVTREELVFLSMSEPITIVENETGNDMTTDTLLSGFVSVLDRESKIKMLDLAKDLFVKKTNEQNLNNLAEGEENE